MNKLNNMIGLLRESLSEANFYAKEVETLLKERKSEKKTSCQCKEEKKERKNPQ